MSDWKADPTRGADFIAPRRDELLTELRNAADVALLAIDQNEAEAIKRIREEAGQKRGKIQKTIKDMDEMEPMRLIRKFWHEKRDVMWLHFLGDQTKVGGIE